MITLNMPKLCKIVEILREQREPNLGIPTMGYSWKYANGATAMSQGGYDCKRSTFML
jgi:hypothetical protein